MPKPARILVVDDDAEDVALISSILQSAGHEVHSAADARTGLEQSKAGRFDVVLLDNRFTNSPVVGISLVGEFAAQAPGGVVMITGFGSEDLEKDARMLGAAAFLTKPVTAESLLSMVAQLLARPPRA